MCHSKITSVYHVMKFESEYEGEMTKKQSKRRKCEDQEFEKHDEKT